MRSTKTPVLHTRPCPWWCVTKHRAVDLDRWVEEKFSLREHTGRAQTLTGVAYSTGGTTTGVVELVQLDNLSTGEREPVGVFAICEGIMTPEQATRYARMILRAADEARRANTGTLVPTSDELRQVTA